MMNKNEKKLISEENYKKIGVEILSVFDNFCRKNNIHYVLGYGTLLGAIRHNGYIPWDDDIDLFVFAEDCSKIARTYKDNKDYKYHNCMYSKTYFLPFDKFSFERTIKVENCNIKINQQIGYNIDIFPIYCFKNKEIAIKCFNKTKLLRKLFSIKIHSAINDSTFKKILIKLIQFLIFLSPNHLSKKIIKIAEKYSCPSNENNSIATLISDVYCNELIFFDSSLLKERALHTFENKNFFIPKNYDPVLKTLYGAYMELPPEDNRITHHSFYVLRK